jgi:hypothetical protein
VYSDNGNLNLTFYGHDFLNETSVLVRPNNNVNIIRNCIQNYLQNVFGCRL